MCEMIFLKNDVFQKQIQSEICSFLKWLKSTNFMPTNDDDDDLDETDI